MLPLHPWNQKTRSKDAAKAPKQSLNRNNLSAQRGDSDLAANRRVSAATQNQALNALVFMNRDVIGGEAGWIGDECPSCFHPTRHENYWES
jgi:hypothetical protein